MRGSGRRLRGGLGTVGPRRPSPFGLLPRGVSAGDCAGRTGLRVRHVLVAVLAALCMPPAHGASAPSEEYRGDTGSMAARETRSQLRSARSEPGGTVGSAARSAPGGTVRSAVSKPGRTVRLPPPAPGEGDTDGDDAQRFLVHRVGFGRDIAGLGVEVPDEGDLRWVSVAGGRAATLVLVSPGAAALRARLEFAALPAGAEVRVHRHPGSGADARFVDLPEDSGGAFAAPRAVSVWTPAVDGESLAIEFFLAEGSGSPSLRVSVPVVSHLEVRPSRLQDIGRASCRHIDAACRAHEVSGTARRSVAKYIFTTWGGRTSGCTGSLLNDSDTETQIPYFLTATHCIQNQSMASSMEFYWFFERTACGATSVRPERTTGGATLLARDAQDSGTDAALLRLNASPPNGVGLAGWTTDTVSAGDRLIAVHHPAGDLKKIVAGRVIDLASRPARGGAPQAARNYMRLRHDGALEGGASGSGTWKRIDGQDYLVGVLSAGYGFFICPTRSYTGRFDRFHPRVSEWLGGESSEAGDIAPEVRLALVDARGGGRIAELTGGGARVDLDYVGTASFNIVAELPHDEADSVRLELSGPQSANSTGRLPHLLYGTGGGSALAPGSHVVTATLYRADGLAWPPTRTTFVVAGTGTGVARAVDALVLVDPVDGKVHGEVASDASVSLEAGLGWESGTDLLIQARTAGQAAIGSVRFSVSGAATVSHTATAAPFTMRATLPFGMYTVTATPFARADGTGAAGTAFAAQRFALERTPSPVSGFTLVDARGGAPDPDIGPIEDGATVDVSAVSGEVSVRADLAFTTGVGSVRLALEGPRSVARVENVDGPLTLFGDDDGDYLGGFLPDGSYTLKATPYAETGGRGEALPAHAVSFSVTGNTLDSPVSGFTLVDARGGAPDPDIGALGDGATVDLSTVSGHVSIRADLGFTAGVGSVRLRLDGPWSFERVENVGGPLSLLGDDGNGDYQGGVLPNGSYTVTATPYAGTRGEGGALPAYSVSFTVTGSRAAGSPPATSFMLVDARGGAPDPDIGALEDGATVDVSAVGGDVSVRTDIDSGAGVGSVRLRLDGPRSVGRTENAGGPFTLFGDHNGDYFSGFLVNGSYRLTATLHPGRSGTGEALASHRIGFTVADYDPAGSRVTGFTLVDPRGGAPDPDLGALADGGIADLSATGGYANVRVNVSSGPFVGHMLLYLRGPRSLDRTEYHYYGTPFALFGDNGRGDYWASYLPNGSYTLTAVPYGLFQRSPWRPNSISFTVTGSGDAGVSPLSGFTLVDARGPAPDPDLRTLEDGATVDVGAFGGDVNIRADLASTVGVASVRFRLAGPHSLDRTENVGGPLALFGDDGNGDYLGGFLANGSYTLTATPYSGRDATDTAGKERTVSFTVAGQPRASPVYRFTLVDAGGAHPDPEVVTIGDGDIVDVSAMSGGVNINAYLAFPGGVGSVRLELAGPRSVARTEDAGGRFTLFGYDGGGDFRSGFLPNGSYTLTATPYTAKQGGGRALPSYSVSFTLTGNPHASPVSGFTLVDARGPAPDPDLGAIADGGTVDVSAAAGEVNIRAELGLAGDVESVRFALAGPISLDRVENTDGPLALFGDDGEGDYFGRFLPNGTYRLTATPYPEAGGRGEALPAHSVSFTVTGFDETDSPVSGFTLVDARDGLPDPDLGAIRDGGRADVSAADGRVNVRADMAPFATDVASVRFRLDGPRAFERTVNAGGAAYSLFGVSPSGDYDEGRLPNGSYTLMATPFMGSNAGGERRRPRAVSFTVTGGTDAPATPEVAITGFTLVDARKEATATDLGAIADGAVLDVSPAAGRVNIRADLDYPELAGSVGLELTGRRRVSRLDVETLHVSLFGENADGHYAAGWLADGAYTLTAKAYERPDGVGDVLATRTVDFTVSGGLAGSTFALVDARGGAPDPDIGPLADRATVDLSDVEGGVNIRLDRDWPAAESVRFTLAGARFVSRIENGAAPYSLFGDDGAGDYRVGWLPDGAYVLTATPYAGRDGTGERMDALSVRFTVRDNPVPGNPLTGFTLVDARGVPPAPDLGPVTEGATLDLSGVGGHVNIRADVPSGRTDVRSVRFELAGARALTHVEEAGSVFSLFGDHAGDNYRVGWLPDGAHTLTATAYGERSARGRELGSLRVMFTVTGGLAGDASPVAGFTLVDAGGTPPHLALSRIPDGGTVDVSPADGVVNVRADMVIGRSVGSVRFVLSGARSVDRMESHPGPFTLFGDWGANHYKPDYLLDGAYTLTATPYTEKDGGGEALAAHTVSFTVTGSRGANASRVTGFTLVDPRGRAPNPDVGPLGDGDTVDVSGTDGYVNVRADLSFTSGVHSVEFELEGPRSVSRFESAGRAFALFGDDGRGDYWGGYLPNGAYRLTATPYAPGRGISAHTGQRVRGAAMAAHTVSFTVTGSRDAGASPLTGFTLVDARGAAPDPDLGALADGGTFDVSAVGGDVSVRANLDFPAGVGSVRFRLEGPRAVERTDNGGPFALFGDDNGGDYHSGGGLPNGSYTLMATPYTERWGRGDALPPREVAFTVTGYDPTGSPVTGFTLVDARDGAPDPDMAPVLDGEAVHTAAAAGRVSVRADTVPGRGVGSVLFQLRGAHSVTQVENAAGAFALFGDDGAGDYAEGELPAGAYTLTAIPYGGFDARGTVYRSRSVAFTVADTLPASRTAGIAAAASRVDEGAAATYTVTLDAPAPAPLGVKVEVAETGGQLSGAAPAWVTFATGASSATLELATEDDALGQGDSVVTATLAAGYGYTVGSPSSAAVTVTDDDAGVALASLSLSGIDIAFAPATTFYTAAVGNDVRRTTVRATATESDAVVAILPADADDDASGHQVDLAVGMNEIAVTVTAAADRSLVYRVAVTRAPPPPVATLAGAGAVSEGVPAVFEAALDRAPAAALTVAVSVAGTDGLLAGTLPTSVLFAAGQTSATLSVATVDDRVVEADGAVTATLVAGTGYTLGADDRPRT